MFSFCVGSSGITSSSSVDQFSHPLASPTTPPSRDTPSPDSDPTAAASGYQGQKHKLTLLGFFSNYKHFYFMFLFLWEQNEEKKVKEYHVFMLV